METPVTNEQEGTKEPGVPRRKKRTRSQPHSGRRASDGAYLQQDLERLLQVMQAAKDGDFSVRMPIEGNGAFAALASTFNELIARNEDLKRELVRLSKVVGRDGDIEERASLEHAEGGWGVAAEAINSLIGDLVWPTTEVTRVITAVASGDLSQRMELRREDDPLKGEFRRLGTTVNSLVDQLTEVTSEVTRVAREVGAEGELGAQAEVKGGSGKWRDLTNSVNMLAGNLTNQVRNIALVTTAVANGDLSQKITVEAKGEILELKNTINVMVDQLRSFAGEVTRVAKEVGTEGKLGGQADVKGVSGVWKDVTDNVNAMASNLTVQLRDVSKVATAIANGDLTRKITVDVKGEVLQIKDVINKMVDQLNSFAAEVTRVAKEVGTEGKLGGQAEIKGVSGTWKDLTDNVNAMASNLTVQLRDVSKVATAIANGDLTQKITVDVKGEILQIKDVINKMVDQLNSFASEVTRVAREVGTQGKLGGQADIKGVSGTWKHLTDNVNAMASNLTVQLRDVSKVATAIANGDLTQKITVDVKGEILQIKDVINKMVDQLNSFAAEVTRVAKEVGTEGKLGGQAEIKGVSGTWKDLTDNVNAMASNLTVQLRDVSKVATAIANGDLTQKITVEVRGEILQIKDVINKMVDQLNSFAAEVTRVAKEVGTDGKLGGQADVKGVSGVWKDLTDNVNFMASNLTTQVRGIVKVVTAVANGDLSQKFVLAAKGEIAALADTINAMTDTLRLFAEQVTTVAREVGIEGKLGGQAKVPGAAGTWRDLTDNVNMLAGNLTSQVRNIAGVTTAVATGDLSQKITVDAKGEILELKNTINAMVEQLRTFAREVTRVAREVGTEGRLGGQAKVPGVGGTWADLTDSVNVMASNLTNQVRGIVKVVTAVAGGDLSQKLVVEAKGEIAALADTINGMTDTLRTFADQVTTVAREVGIDGKLGGQARVPGAAGTWRDLTDNVNMLAGNLTSQVRNIAAVTTAVANGDLSKKITVDAKGEILELKDTINAMVEQLRTFASEVTRVAREVGTDGKLGGQAAVPGVAGTWKDLTDNVNLMASNLTDQVRGIVKVVTAVAMGDLTRKLTVEAKGEIAALADTINNMTDTLRTFAEQVTSVAREVGIEGKLGGQAKVPGAAGTWRDLTDNVNQLAGNLTTQVRAISEVATAVTKGDLTRTIDVEAQGEVLSLKDTIIQMIANLRDTTHANKEQDWLKTNLAKFTAMMQGQRSLESLAELLMSELTPVVSSQVGTFFVLEHAKSSRPVLTLCSSYGYKRRKNISNSFAIGEGLVGQAAREKKTIIVTQVPEDYVQITSSIGEATPRSIAVLPIIFEGQVKGVIELGSFEPFSLIHITFLEQLMLSIGVVFNMISASRRTEELLQELQRSNTELENRSKELEDKASLLEVKNREIAEASSSLEEKAKQLALVSKYKSEFLANMSHELRTPLNSMLILSELLIENADKNLNPKQLEYVRTINSSGKDLLNLISQILDLSKIEAGKMDIEKRRVPLAELRKYAERHFKPIAQQKALDFSFQIDPEVPPSITTDSQRLEQILKNLLSNAFKFTDGGSVKIQVSLDINVQRFRHPVLRKAPAAISFAVSDSGIGIPRDKQQLVFEAFQQADPSTSRTHGGTGLGLTISRELARLLGGEITLQSTPGEGSTFTLHLPLREGDQRAPAPTEPGGVFERSHSPVEQAPEVVAVQPPTVDETSAEPMKDLAGKKILVVDDDVRNLFAVTSMLERHGVEPLSAGSAREAIAIVGKMPDVDLVLMDIMMPEVDGYQATRAIRDMGGRFTGVPIIALTAKAMPGDRERCLEAGCSDFVPKPVGSKRLLQTIRSALKVRGNEP